ncbi:hypothetical protein J7E93_30555 [Streptomyces sp. ISL-36]|uniref:hypothetical protein n=1 Tax=Streptomyces sp. ISL-36 TaxID=2819182 RepID=UPI001BE6726B|nr:hypothetical protein [Streptomyces sp. ISL-36]MBT2444360.1 hypothetical protein [Streptomyces sp. ISL-36]
MATMAAVEITKAGDVGDEAEAPATTYDGGARQNTDCRRRRECAEPHPGERCGEFHRLEQRSGRRVEHRLRKGGKRGERKKDNENQRRPDPAAEAGLRGKQPQRTPQEEGGSCNHQKLHPPQGDQESEPGHQWYVHGAECTGQGIALGGPESHPGSLATSP